MNGGPLYYHPTRDRFIEPKEPKESNISPEGGIIPVLYGRRKITGKFVYLNVINNIVHGIWIFCEGEIDGFDTILLNNKNIIDYGNKVYYETYQGTDTQPVCSLSNYDSSWTYSLPNTAYIYIRCNQTEDIQDLPKIEAIIKGKKIYVPRINTITYSANPALILADILTNTRYGGRIPPSKINYGTAQSHPDGTVWASADYCDEPLIDQTIQICYIGKRYTYSVVRDSQAKTDTLHAIYILSESSSLGVSSISLDGIDIAKTGVYYELYHGTGTTPSWPGWDNSLVGKSCIYIRKVFNAYTHSFGDVESRHRINVKATLTEPAVRYGFSFCFNQQVTLQDAIETIRRHFLGVIRIDNGLYSIDVAKPRPTIASFEEKEVWGLQIQPLQSQDIINRVTWTWTDPFTWETVTEEIEDPNISQNDEIHEANYDLTGCLSYARSKRIATFLLNSRLSDLIVTFNTYNGKGLQPLDVFSITHSIGLTNKLLYVSNIQENPDGSWTITGNEYDPAFFNEDIITEPAYPDTSLPDPSKMPDDATNLSLTEQLVQLKDSTWISNIKITWKAPEWPFIKHYEIYVKQGSGDFILLGTTTGTEYEYRAAKELETYTFAVVTVSTWDKRSIGITSTIIPQGKYLKPKWKTGAQLRGEEAGNVVFLKWYMPDLTPPAEDIDIIGYEIRRGKIIDTWETSFYVGFVDALIYQDNFCPSGQWRYFIKAKDSVGNYTDTSLYCDVTVILNQNIGFTSDYNFDLATVTGTNIGITMNTTLNPINPNYDILGERFPGPTLGDGVGGYTYLIHPTITTADGTTAAIDLGQIISGKYTLYYQSTKVGNGSSTLTPKLITSIDGSTWTEYDASSSLALKARYIKAKFEFNNPYIDTTYIVQEPVYITIQVDPVEEYGTAAVPADGYIAIAFINSFMAIEKITLTVLGNIAKTAVADNLTTSGFTLRLFDTNNNPTSGTVKWLVQGY
ncbi:MAG: hypothetical protein QXT63_01470 [Thermoplasmata archaeon]